MAILLNENGQLGNNQNGNGHADSGHSHVRQPSHLNALPIPIELLRKHLSVPLLCDALDAAGYRNQSPRLPMHPLTTDGSLLIGRAKTTLWADMSHEDPSPYKNELEAIDSCQHDDVIVCAASGSMRSGLWGELLSGAAMNRGCVGVIVDGAVRDLAKMKRMGFPVFALGTCPYDSRNRQRVIDFDVVIEIDGVQIAPGDIIAADLDGVAVVPKAIEQVVIQAAWDKAHAENEVRRAVEGGMSATEAYKRFGVL
jgi:4-hydroxy-4-methyl-2-oxoglutarate aldolase